MFRPRSETLFSTFPTTGRHVSLVVQGRRNAQRRGPLARVVHGLAEPADIVPEWHDAIMQITRKLTSHPLYETDFIIWNRRSRTSMGYYRRNATNDDSESPSHATGSEQESVVELAEAQQDDLDTVEAINPDQHLSISSTFALVNLDVSVEALTDAVDIYVTMVHMQPIPLFRPNELLDYLKSSSRHLRYSFLALGLSLKAQTAQFPTQFDLIDNYARCARAEVHDLASQGISKLQVVQSLCLLTLRDILVCKPHQAQMTIGTASRLESCRSAANNAFPEAVDTDLSLRCSWSVYILERAFSPHLCISDEEIPGPNFPASASIPPPSSSSGREDYPSDLYNLYDSSIDHGITAYFIRMISNWGHISRWLNHIRLAKPESPWSPESKYARLIARVYECDSQLPTAHLLRNVAFSKRSSAEILQHREYWIPWVLMQVQCHAYLSILNHPFIHLVAVRNCSKGLQSGMFLQHTLDAARFHSGWVFHFLRLCDDHQLELHDPFIGQLVGAVATIPWLLQFVEDEKVSQKAARDVAWCITYLSRVSQTWPHLYQKLEIIQSLQLIAEHHDQNRHDNGRGVTFPPGLIWELLDPDMCYKSPQRVGPQHAPQTRIQITTNMTHPLAESSKHPAIDDEVSDLGGTFDTNGGGLEQVYIDDLVSHFMLYNGQTP
ncbi:hypothetical protein FSHL1_006542 [Fusarium sambucinum]